MKTSAVSLCVVLYTSRNYVLNKAADTNIYLLMQLSVRFGSVQCWMMDKCGNQPCFLYIERQRLHMPLDGCMRVNCCARYIPDKLL